MRQTLKKRRIPLLLGGGVLLIALLVFLIPRDAGAARAQASVQSAEAEVGALATTVTGTGNLVTEVGLSMNIPIGLTVDEVYVEAGDIVSEGDVLASFDMGSIQSRIAAVQEELEELDREIERVRNDTEATQITTRIAGRVETLFAAEGDRVTDIMLEHGALAHIIIDGTEEGELAIIGTSGQVTRVHVQEGARVSAGAVLFTLADVDASPAYRELLRDRTDLADSLNNLLRLARTGELVADFDGIIERVAIGDSASGTGGMTIPNMPNIPSMPGGMFGLMRHTEPPTQPSGVFQVTRLSNAESAPLEVMPLEEGDGGSEPTDPAPELDPAPTPDTAPTPTPGRRTPTIGITDLVGFSINAPIVGALTAQPTLDGRTDFRVAGGVWNPPFPIFLPGMQYQILVFLQVNDAATTYFSPQVLDWIASGPQFWPSPGTNTTITDAGIFFDGQLLVFMVNFPRLPDLPSITLPDLDVNINLPDFNFPDFDFTMPDFDFDFPDFDFNFPDFDFNFPDFEFPDFDFNFPDFDFNLPNFSMPDFSMPGFNLPGMDTAPNAFETTAFTIAPADAMRLVVNVDERDILALQSGQRAEISLDAIDGEMFEGAIRRINTSGTAAGGGARYAVEVFIPRTADMLPGMSASAVIITEEVFDILLIPVEALQEEGTRIFVYTAQVGGEPAEPVEVRTGLSDGVFVEIIAGLSAGDTVYYTVIETFRWPMWGMGPGFGGGGGGGDNA
ncbi:MAG: hypothetical protein FWD84_02375 [Oscillospiraceae bacterium]|nr:hypothetical protein [Oscillospiraceae bacterium]